jgi:hypothetical protein
LTPYHGILMPWVKIYAAMSVHPSSSSVSV